MIRNLILIAFVVSCTGSHDQKLHEQSIETHDLAIQIGKHVNEKIKRIAQYAHKMEEPIKSLLLDSVHSLDKDFAYWQSIIVEVPGHEHDHEGHDHDHETPPDITPVMMLDIQKDLRNRIVKLNIRAQKLLNTLEKDEGDKPVEEGEKPSTTGV